MDRAALQQENSRDGKDRSAGDARAAGVRHFSRAVRLLRPVRPRAARVIGLLAEVTRRNERGGKSQAAIGDFPRRYCSISRLTSRAAAEWVIAPTAIRSTPVEAIDRTVSSVTPPEASSST